MNTGIITKDRTMEELIRLGQKARDFVKKVFFYSELFFLVLKFQNSLKLNS